MKKFNWKKFGKDLTGVILGILIGLIIIKSLEFIIELLVNVNPLGLEMNETGLSVFYFLLPLFLILILMWAVIFGVKFKERYVEEVE